MANKKFKNGDKLLSTEVYDNTTNQALNTFINDNTFVDVSSAFSTLNTNYFSSLTIKAFKQGKILWIRVGFVVTTNITTGIEIGYSSTYKPSTNTNHNGMARLSASTGWFGWWIDSNGYIWIEPMNGSSIGNGTQTNFAITLALA